MITNNTLEEINIGVPFMYLDFMKLTDLTGDSFSKFSKLTGFAQSRF